MKGLLYLLLLIVATVTVIRSDLSHYAIQSGGAGSKQRTLRLVQNMRMYLAVPGWICSFVVKLGFRGLGALVFEVFRCRVGYYNPFILI